MMNPCPESISAQYKNHLNIKKHSVEITKHLKTKIQNKNKTRERENVIILWNKLG